MYYNTLLENSCVSGTILIKIYFLKPYKWKLLVLIGVQVVHNRCLNAGWHVELWQKYMYWTNRTMEHKKHWQNYQTIIQNSLPNDKLSCFLHTSDLEKTAIEILAWLVFVTVRPFSQSPETFQSSGQLRFPILPSFLPPPFPLSQQSLPGHHSSHSSSPLPLILPVKQYPSPHTPPPAKSSQ